jgi:hypothetical protein
VSGTESVSTVYSYPAPSALRRTSGSGAGGGELALATSGGVTEAGPVLHPYFYAGFLADPGPAALGMLAVAAVAAARYHEATRRALGTGTGLGLGLGYLDPVVTSNVDTLRFESFSGCRGVHARLDLPPGALDGAPVANGTTNVDFNPPMRAALAAAAATGSPILLKVGDDEVTAVTETASVTERKVALPARWVKGFGEVQALAQAMRQVAELTGPEAGRFLSSLPRGARRPLWAHQAGRTLALGVTPRPGAACLAAAERLVELRPLLRFATRLRVYAPSVSTGGLPTPSAWELSFGAARLTLTLSPEKHRGFSGEGALLGGLAAEADADADLLAALLPWDARIDPARLARITGLSTERTGLSLARLAASGSVGYDLAEQSFFHRELPFTLADNDHPRLRDARALLAAGLVTLTPAGALVASEIRGAEAGGGAETGGETAGDAPAVGHRVTFGSPRDLCTCPWWGKHQGTRGPCKHVLAARIAARERAAL